MYDDVVLCCTLPVFTGLGWCPIVNWDFAGAVSILDWMPFLMPTLLLYPGLGLAGEYQKINPQADVVVVIVVV